MNGKHSRKASYLGNRNKIVRIKHLETHLHVEMVSFVLDISYQEAFGKVMERCEIFNISPKVSASQICDWFRITGIM